MGGLWCILPFGVGFQVQNDLFKELKMLVLSRYRDESIYIGDDIVITVVDIRGDRVRIGVQAPPNVSVHRQEVYEAIKNEQSGLGNRKVAAKLPSVPSGSVPPGQELSKPRKVKIATEARALPVNIEVPVGFDGLTDIVPQ